MAAAHMHVTVLGAGNNDGLTWGNAMAMADFVGDAEGSAEPGDKYYVKGGGGVYTIGEAFDMSSQDGTAPLPIWIIGVKAATSNEGAAIVVGDHATGANRPVFAMEANDFIMATYWKKYGIDFTGSDNLGVTVDDYCVLFNCKTSHSGTYGLYHQGHNSIAVACEATGMTTAVNAGNYVQLIACYFHDTTNGVEVSNLGVGVYHCVIDTCSGYGISVNERSGARIINNIIYNCGKGILGTTAVNCTIINNILDANTVGIEWTTQTWANYIDFNCWDNTDDIQDTDVEIGFYAVTADPGMNGPAGGDFRIADGDNAAFVGLDVGTFTAAQTYT